VLTWKTKFFFAFARLQPVKYQTELQAVLAPSLFGFYPSLRFVCMYQQVTALSGFTKANNYRKGQIINLHYLSQELPRERST
jgi:hypothetical protein